MHNVMRTNHLSCFFSHSYIVTCVPHCYGNTALHYGPARRAYLNLREGENANNKQTKQQRDKVPQGEKRAAGYEELELQEMEADTFPQAHQ